MKVLYSGFDLVDPTTSVSMTINGPAPTILAMFLNTAIDQQLAAFAAKNDREPTEAEAAEIRAQVLRTVRGTVQADILKEDQAQNTCIFSTEFALGMMADIQEWFVEHEVRSFYSVSISGYHIAEAGANPLTQLAFTLSNGFTYVESYLSRGLPIDAFAPNLSFFFSNGMDPEYSVLGRVARRIWAVAMRDRYGANERSQKLKYHVQTSGRSLHAQEMDFNDIRTTLQALIAIYDNCNSLHTNAYDEAVTTPTTESVRRALAIQMIINKEWGLAMNENPNQGSFVIDQLTDLVEEAVLQELERISERGGVLGAMETGYQRGRIQDESMRYEQRKHDGSLPIVGVNTFLDPKSTEASPATIELARSTDDEKRSQLERLHAFQARHADERPDLLARLSEAARAGGVGRPDGDRLPARPQPGRVEALRAAQARRLAPHRGRQHLPRPEVHGGGAGHHRAGPQHRRREAQSARAAPRLPGTPRRRAPGHARPAERGRAGGRQPLRRADGRRAGLQPRRDHRHPLRGRRPLPPQRLVARPRRMEIGRAHV